MPTLYIFDHIAKNHIAYPARVISTGEVITEHDGHIPGEVAKHFKRTFDVEYETAPAVPASEGVLAKAAKTSVMWGAHRKDDLAHWQGKNYFEPDAEAARPVVQTAVVITESTPPSGENGPPKPKK